MLNNGRTSNPRESRHNQKLMLESCQPQFDSGWFKERMGCAAAVKNPSHAASAMPIPPNKVSVIYQFVDRTSTETQRCHGRPTLPWKDKGTGFSDRSHLVTGSIAHHSKSKICKRG